MVYINDKVDSLDLDLALAQVSEQRREQALRFRFESGRRLCLAAYLLLMEGLQKEYGITEKPVFDYSEKGKPSIIGHPDIYFNFSHSGNIALCALCNQPVGADVETLRKITPSLIRFTMNDIEQTQINTSSNPTMQFLFYWTRKEALLKLTGDGIRNNMKDVLTDSSDNYHIETVTSDQYVYSIANYL